jgi:UDP-N-acetylmuramoyl-L-alanyl-D-glutamate--2,6-diaminopimelate ligase
MSMPAMNMSTSKSLDSLLLGLADAPPLAVSGIAADSRRLRQEYLFLAVGGETNHGLDYVEDAIRAGVAAIAFDSNTATAPGSDIGVPVIAVPGLAGRLGEIANRFYGFPSRDVRVIGVTGTNGKTTVAWLAAQCLDLLGSPCGYLGTLGAGIGEIESAADMTTPGAVELHSHLDEFRRCGATYAAIEVSSHALAQNRVDGVGFEAAIFTNLSRDHLDYHGDLQSYFEAKARLFIECPVEHRIINLDTEYGEDLASRCGGDSIAVSTRLDRAANHRRFVFVRSVVADERGSKVGFTSSWGDGEFMLHLPGDFNVANAVEVLALLLQQGATIEQASDALSCVTAPPGRMQRIPAVDDQLPTVYVDYAHTPAALELALRALSAHCKGALWCVFGCGGDRDSGKRPQMGQIAERLADRVIVTTDNPRSEDPAAIIANIVAGLQDADSATVIEDRATAIAWVIDSADPADVILIAGKGHEDYQLIAGQRLDFSDFGAATANLRSRSEAGT